MATAVHTMTVHDLAHLITLGCQNEQHEQIAKILTDVTDVLQQAHDRRETLPVSNAEIQYVRDLARRLRELAGDIPF